jgi:hypothetical protein
MREQSRKSLSGPDSNGKPANLRFGGGNMSGYGVNQVNGLCPVAEL